MGRFARQFGWLPTVIGFVYATGDRLIRTACVAGIAMLAALGLYFVAIPLRNRRIRAGADRARAATLSDLERAGHDLETVRARVRALLLGRSGRELRAAAANRPRSRGGALGGWVAIVGFVAAAFLVGAWGDTRAQRAEDRAAVPLDLRLPHAYRGSGDPLGDVFEHLSSFLKDDGSNLSLVLGRATPGERMTYVLEDVDEEIGNGGFEQLYWNPDGALVPDAIRYVRMLEARSYAHALEVSTAVFPGGIVPASEAARQRLIGPFGSKRPALAKADALWPERAYAPALRAYVRAHPAQFFR